VAFAFATAITRGGLGYDLAMSTRYLYVVIGFSIPLAALALSEAVRAKFVPLVGVLVSLGLLTVYTATNLAAEMSSRIENSQLERETFAAAADLISANPGRYDPDLVLLDYWADDVTVANLQRMMDEGWYTPGTYPLDVELGLRLKIDLMVEDRSVTPTDACEVIPIGALDTALDSRDIRLYAAVPTTIEVTLTESGVTSRMREIWLDEGGHRLTFTGNADLTIVTTDRDLVSCLP
jgi:hypothetical protein